MERREIEEREGQQRKSSLLQICVYKMECGGKAVAGAKEHKEGSMAC